MKSSGARKRRGGCQCFVLIIICCGICAAASVVLLASRSVDSIADVVSPIRFDEQTSNNESESNLNPVKKRILEKDSELQLEKYGSLKNESGTDSETDGRLMKSWRSGNGKVEVKKCATVEEMGAVFERGFEEPSLRVRRMIQEHFKVHGAARVRSLPPEQFCKSGFVIGKAFQAGFGNEMYKILTGAVLSIMLNRSLIIGQTRHFGSNSA